VKEAVKEVATSIPLAPLAPGEGPIGGKQSPFRNNRNLQLGMMAAALALAGFTVARRGRHVRQSNE
jgi:hypothetical protein